MPRYRPVIGKNAVGREIYFKSMSDAAAAVGVRPGAICAAIMFEQKCHGFSWRYADEPKGENQ